MVVIDPLKSLVKSTTLLAKCEDQRQLVESMTDHALDITQSDLGALFLMDSKDQKNLNLAYKRGRLSPEKKLFLTLEDIRFLEDCGESILLNQRIQEFESFFLFPEMQSALALPLISTRGLLGVLILNRLKTRGYGKDALTFGDAFGKTAAGLLSNQQLFAEIKTQMKEIDGLQRYQQRVFASMTNMLITTNNQGLIQYYNPQAEIGFDLSEEDLGKDFKTIFENKISRGAVNHIGNCLKTGQEILGYEGIFRQGDKSLDFSLNLSPLLGKRGGMEGLTLLFTDQSHEKELKSAMKVAKEERRLIKDMFSRYLSRDVVQSLIDQPELVKLGGDKKAATLFFADIRGYTSFSEGKDPAYIIEVLNEYFSKAVDVILKYNGYIDKFIGDCIMAAWGVPMFKEEEDAICAVKCALEIQDLVKHHGKSFFTGEANNLQVGIGMNSGPLVAGNLGSSTRMEYSMIGDTVNVAARLEGVAGGGEVIINHTTRDLVGDSFRLKELKPVKVKGKEKPLPIFSVLGVA